MVKDTTKFLGIQFGAPALIGAAILGWYLLKPKNVWGEKPIGGYIANISNPLGTELLENKA